MVLLVQSGLAGKHESAGDVAQQAGQTAWLESILP